MSEALSQVIRFGLIEMKLRSINAHVHSDNTRSITLLRKFDFSEQTSTGVDTGLRLLRLSNHNL